MADITMCTNKECKLNETCYRFTAKANEYYQSYMCDPKQDCEERDYDMYISNE